MSHFPCSLRLLPHLSLDERLAQQLHAAQAAGDVMMIDCSSDEEDAVPPPPLKKEIVMEKVVVPPKKVSQEEESEYEDKEDDEEEYSDEDDGEGYEQPSREPESGDTVFVTWDDDPTEYLCIVEDGEDGKGLAISSADMKFTETLKFDPELDIWKFSSGNVKKGCFGIRRNFRRRPIPVPLRSPFRYHRNRRSIRYGVRGPLLCDNLVLRGTRYNRG